MNLALLGKHCWRIASQPHSLFNHVFKGKYLRYENVMSAEIGAALSEEDTPDHIIQSHLQEGKEQNFRHGKKVRMEDDGQVFTGEQDPTF
ncbi:hypothetical protein Ahy_B02g061378 [Arachis hypogaea]|uniref:Uncharacterized protein n=1 Tax=Arachis hypogaea TaxID=3818 RepID=A0A445AKT1_ARAHY|nr:hypothetical protein Ahy_B02g061378 [Arachis hypogaea]